MIYNRERVAELFDGKVDHIDSRPDDAMFIQVGSKALDALELNTDDILLDAGTGTGRNAIKAARSCSRVIGIDISRKSLDRANEKASEEGLKNLEFLYGSIEDPNESTNISSYGITKVLVNYSLHHLPDDMKKQGLAKLASIMKRPGRMVVGDMMFFESPETHEEKFEEVGYDGGEHDYPSTMEFLKSTLEGLGASVKVERLHPLAGILIADF